jgi:hypothetical protein
MKVYVNIYRTLIHYIKYCEREIEEEKVVVLYIDICTFIYTL